MKFWKFISCIHLLFIFGCSETESELIKELNANKNNFKNYDTERYLGLKYEIPTVLKHSYVSNIVLDQKQSKVYASEERTVHITIEKFSKTRVLLLRKKSSQDNKSDLSWLNDYFTRRRSQTFENAEITLPTNLKSKTNKKGYIQLVTDRLAPYNADYAIATIETNNNFYVLQLIASKELLPYLYDDFLKVIQSIQ